MSLSPQERELYVDGRYLLLPVQKKIYDEQTEVRLLVENREVRMGRIGLADSPENVTWTAYYTVEAYRGQTLTVRIASATPEGADLIRISETLPDEATVYREPWRPQFHFTHRSGWINDPNGMVFHKGTWHFFFQHNPLWEIWGNMTWGHATSKDLLHWEQQEDALHHRVSGKGAMFSGGGVVDVHNTAGFGSDAIMIFFTDTEAGESLAVSTDNGATFVPFSGNPLIGHDQHPEANPDGKPSHMGRDPKVIWYAYQEGDEPLDPVAARQGGHWLMCVYVWEPDEIQKEDKENIRGHYGAFYTSNDLQHWTLQSRIEGFFECMDLFRLPMGTDTYWVLFGADAQYALGSFDGRVFTPLHEGKYRIHYGPFYASQTFEQAPDDRRVQIGWLRIDTPAPPYNQHFSIPYELTLVDTAEGPRMRANPIPELEQLRTAPQRAAPRQLSDGQGVKLEVGSDLLDVTLEFTPEEAAEIRMSLPGREIVYNAIDQTLQGAPLTPENGRIRIRVLADRLLTETIGNGGQVCISEKGTPGVGEQAVTLQVKGGSITLARLDVYEMASVWQKDADTTSHGSLKDPGQ